MLPLSPPPRPVEPGYPTRDHVLGDRTLRRQALSVLAAAILTGCSGEPVPPAQQQPTGGTPVPTTPAAPNRLPGEASAPTPTPAPTPPAEPLSEPKPVVLGGIVAVPPPPEPAPLRGDVAVPEQPEPAPLRGKPVSDPPPPAPVKP